MARAFVVFARNDIPAGLLQITDLWPNTSQATGPFAGLGQTGYLSFQVPNDVPALTADGGGAKTLNADTFGVGAYLLDMVENKSGGGTVALTEAQVAAMMTTILGRIKNGQSLAAADIDAAINGAAGVATSDFDGKTQAGSKSTGKVKDFLEIMSGKMYKVAKGAQLANNANAFPVSAGAHTPKGGFALAPNLAKNVNKPGGKDPQTPVGFGTSQNTGFQDPKFKNVLVLHDTGALRKSASTGVLSGLKSATFALKNPAFTYGASGTAKAIDNTALPSTGVGRAIVVYAEDGSVI